MRGKRLRFFTKPGTGERLSFLTKQYYIFKDSRIWNHEKRRFLKQCDNHHGYLVINLTDDSGKHTYIGVHVLLASVFQRLLKQGEVVHHKNRDRKDNRLENIEIITASEHQRRHSIDNWANGTFDGLAAKLSEIRKKDWTDGKYDGVAAKLSKQVAQLDKNGRLVKIWPSVMETGRNGYNFRHVSECCRGKHKSHHGYKWQWYEDYLAQQTTAQQRWEARQLHLAF